MLTFSALKYEDDSFHERFNSYLDRKNQSSNEVAATVAKIILEVRTNGDSALRSFTKDFDNFDCDNFLISQQEFDQASDNLDHELIESLEYAFENISNYQFKCYESLNLEPFTDDVKRKFRVVDSVGMYIPGGQASYPSTVLMAAAPALACGVRDISLTTPAQNGLLNSLTIAAAKVAGVNKIYKIGGAQAIAALALGTDQVSKVDKIIGPGNAFVAEAKKQLFGEVGIDSIAGPSEIVILADDTSDPETIAWDLMAQSEHDSDASAVLISSSDKLIDEVKKIINEDHGESVISANKSLENANSEIAATKTLKSDLSQPPPMKTHDETMVLEIIDQIEKRYLELTTPIQSILSQLSLRMDLVESKIKKDTLTDDL